MPLQDIAYFQYPMSVSGDEKFRLLGGHLLAGTIVHKSLDVLIGVIPNLNKRLIGSS